MARIVAPGFSAGGEMAAFMGTTGNMPLFNGTGCNTAISAHVNAVVDIDGVFIQPAAPGLIISPRHLIFNTQNFNHAIKSHYSRCLHR